MQRTVTRALALLALAFAASSAPAQSALRIIVPFPPGGTTDAAARLVAQSASTLLGRAVAVENKAGGGGSIGLAAIASSPADGSTLGLASHSSLRGMAAAGQPVPKLEVVAGLALADFVVLAHQGAPDLRSGRGAIGFSGAGGQYCAEELARKNPGLTPVEYRGATPAMTDLSNGVSQFACVALGSATSALQTGRVRALATTGPERSRLHPSVPTVTELGITDAMLFEWMVLVVPEGTPADVKAQLTRAFAASVTSASDRLTAMGMQPFSPAEAADTARLQGFLDRRLAEMRR